jgi:site-specific recombinase XerD
MRLVRALLVAALVMVTLGAAEMFDSFAVEVPGGDFSRRLRAWEDYLDVGENLSQRTRYAYRNALIRFFADTLVDPTAPDLNEQHVTAYLRQIRSTSARADMTRALKSFGRYAVRTRGRDPTERLKVPRPRRQRHPIIPDEAVRRLLCSAFRREPRRGWTFLLIDSTGGRIGSVVALEAADVGPDEIVFRVTKGDRPYSVPLSRPARIAARHLTAEQQRSRAPTLVGVGAERIRQWMREAAEDAGVSRTLWHPHQLRHHFLTHLARVTDPGTWRRLANHSDLSQYPTYVAEDRSLEERAVEQAWH